MCVETSLQKNNQSPLEVAKNGKKILLGLGVVLFVALLIDASPFGLNNVQLYAKWLQCGGRPYVGKSTFSTADIDHYGPSRSFITSRSMVEPVHFFCTPREAELAGYSADSSKVVFPHLSEEEKKSMHDEERR